MQTLEEIVKSKNNIEENTVFEDLSYNDIIYKLEECRDNNIPLEEGLFSSIFGALGGATIGPPIMKGICKVLGIDEKGSLGSLMTSRMILTALGGYLGWKN